MAVEIQEFTLESTEDKNLYLILIAEGKYIIDTTVTASYDVVDQWIAKRLEENNFDEHNKLVVGIGMQWVNVKGVPFKECPPTTLQLCIKSHCLIYQLCHSHTPSVMLSYLFGFTDKFVNFVCLRCPDDFLKKLDLVHSVHELKFSSGNLPVDLRPQVASTEENGLCPTLPKIAQKYIDPKFEMDMDNTKSNWGAHQLNGSQVIYASVIAFLPFFIELRSRISAMLSSLGLT